jgi:hypothetical protein
MAGRPEFLDHFWRIFSGLADWLIIHTFCDVERQRMCNIMCYGGAGEGVGRLLDCCGKRLKKAAFALICVA